MQTIKETVYQNLSNELQYFLDRNLHGYLAIALNDNYCIQLYINGRRLSKTFRYTSIDTLIRGMEGIARLDKWELFDNLKR